MPNLETYTFPYINCFRLPHANFSGFKHLKTLVIEEFKVEKDVLLYLFYKCFNLGNLIFIDCIFHHMIHMVSSTLRSLKLTTSRLPTKIGTAASDLPSFVYCENILSIFSIDLPKLSKFCLTPWNLKS